MWNSQEELIDFLQSYPDFEYSEENSEYSKFAIRANRILKYDDRFAFPKEASERMKLAEATLAVELYDGSFERTLLQEQNVVKASIGKLREEFLPDTERSKLPNRKVYSMEIENLLSIYKKMPEYHTVLNRKSSYGYWQQQLENRYGYRKD